MDFEYYVPRSEEQIRLDNLGGDRPFTVNVRTTEGSESYVVQIPTHHRNISPCQMRYILYTQLGIELGDVSGYAGLLYPSRMVYP